MSSHIDSFSTYYLYHLVPCYLEFLIFLHCVTLHIYTCSHFCVCVKHLNRCKTSTFTWHLNCCKTSTWAGGRWGTLQSAANEDAACSTKTLQCSCENVPAIFQFFVNGNRLSQEPACRFQTIFKPNLMSGRERFASSKDVEIQTSRFFSDLVFILFLSGLMECFCT